MRSTGWRRALAPAAAFCLILTAAAQPAAAAGARADAGSWTATWGSAMQRPTKGAADTGPNWSLSGFGDHTLRQVIRVTAAAPELRVRLSNRYGTKPLKLSGATVGRSAGGAAVWPGTSRALRFGGRTRTEIPPGGQAVSDPVALPTSPLERLAVTLRLPEATGPATFHRFTTATSYRAAGDRLSDLGGRAFTESTAAWYYLTGVEVAAAAPAVVVFGDSLVDGVGSTPGAETRFTDQLAERLVAAGSPASVVSAGIAGGRLLNDSPCFGDRALDRLGRDVLDRPGVKAVVVHLGANDLAYPGLDDPCAKPDPKVGVEELIAGHRRLIAAARARGIRTVGVTVIPLRGALFPFWTKEIEAARVALNHWIRTSGAYDVVLDADRAMSDPAAPDRPRPGYVFMDGLHPDDAGAHAIAAALDLRRLL
ncbi:GDSL-type esterase/lipase family protein [Nonomuraea sp. NPDC051191]|uniref:GDSL-type esterase/lipase family protein n=1 Tax=Nonomuraea sp. NPDC051191 TaxID=3364372 RepID=UPI00379BC18C